LACAAHRYDSFTQICRIAVQQRHTPNFGLPPQNALACAQLQCHTLNCFRKPEAELLDVLHAILIWILSSLP